MKKLSCREIEVGLKSCKEIGVELFMRQGRAMKQSINTLLFLHYFVPSFSSFLSSSLL
jgi:hypothetical protein